MYFARIYRIDLLTIPTQYVTIVKTYSDKKVHKTLKKNRKKERENFWEFEKTKRKREKEKMRNESSLV